MDGQMKRWMDGSTGGLTDTQTERRLCRHFCSLFRLNRHFTANLDLICISAPYFDLITFFFFFFFDVMTSDKNMDVPLKNRFYCYPAQSDQSFLCTHWVAVNSKSFYRWTKKTALLCALIISLVLLCFIRKKMMS